MNIEAILFDMGGVMVNCDPKPALSAFAAGLGKPYEEVYAAIANEEVISPFELGQISPEDYFEKVKATLGCDLNYQDFVVTWNSIITEFPESTQLIKTLRSRYRLVALSNTNELHQEHMINTMPNLKGLHDWATSWEIGSAKPDTQIFEVAVQKAGVCRDNILYIDDRKEFVEAGRQFGLIAAHCFGPVQLQAALQKLGVLTSEHAPV